MRSLREVTTIPALDSDGKSHTICLLIGYHCFARPETVATDAAAFGVKNMSPAGALMAAMAVTAAALSSKQTAT